MEISSQQLRQYHQQVIDCCPICSCEEFLLAEDNQLLLCKECGPVTLTANDDYYPKAPSAIDPTAYLH